MRVALTGVTGFIGSHLARRLVDAGHEVSGLVRETSDWGSVQPYCFRLSYGDQADESVWPELLDGCDCVIHNSVDWQPIQAGHDQRGGLRRHLLENLVGSIRLLERSHPRQFIFVSSIAVHHGILPRWRNRPDEDHPLLPSTPYGAYKAAVEAHLWAEHFGRERHTSAVRPCAVYGMDPKIDRSMGYGIVRKLLEDRRYVRSGGGKFVHVDDVTAAIVALVGNAGAAGQAYNLVDSYARWSDWAEWSAEILRIRPEITVNSPPEPENTFDVSKALSLDGVRLDRGQAGMRAYLEELIAAMRKAGLAG